MKVGINSSNVVIHMLRSVVKSVLPVLLIFGTSGAFSSVSAQLTRNARADASIESAQDMLAWMQESSSVVQGLMPLMGNDLLGELLAPVSDENVDLEALGIAVQSYGVARAEILAQSQKNIDALPPPERWNFDRSLFSAQERGIYKASKQQYADLQNTHDAFATISGELLSAFEKISNGEEIDIQPFIESISETSLRVLKSENRVLKAFSASMPSTSPNKDFHDLMIALNNSTIVEMEMLADYEPGIDPISKRHSYGRQMKAALSDVPHLLKSGRAKIGKQINFYTTTLGNKRLTDTERELVTAIIPAMQTFNQSFDVEQQLLENDLSTANLYISDRTDSDIEQEIESNSLKLDGLLNQRMSIMMDRISSLQ